MANYMLVDADKLEGDLTTVADSIRSKAGKTGEMKFPDEFKSVVDGIVLSSGTTNQEKSGSVNLGSNSNTANVGFKPDVVSITVSGYPALTAVFKNSTSIDVWAGNDQQQQYPFLCVNIKQTSTGFTVSGAYRIDWELDDATYSGTGNYTAIKYTK
jgi:hypothetical protein